MSRVYGLAIFQAFIGGRRAGPVGASLLDLIASLQELHTVGVGFVSLTEALDMTTPAGRALAGMLALFAEFERDILRDRSRSARRSRKRA